MSHEFDVKGFKGQLQRSGWRVMASGEEARQSVAPKEPRAWFVLREPGQFRMNWMVIHHGGKISYRPLTAWAWFLKIALWWRYRTRKVDGWNARQYGRDCGDIDGT